MKTEFPRHFFRWCQGFCMYLLLTELVLQATEDRAPSWVLIASLAAVYIGNYLLRTVLRHVWPLMIYTAATSTAAWFLLPEGELGKLLFTGLAVGLMFTGMRYVSSGGILPQPQDIPWPVILMGLIATVFGLVKKNQELVWTAAVLTGVSLIFYLLVLYADNTRKYVNSTRDIRGVPLRQILRMNSWIIGGIFLCMIVAILLGEALHLPDAFVGLGEALLSIGKTVFFGTALLFTWIGQLFQFTSKSDVKITAQKLKEEVVEGHAFANVLEVVLKVLFVALVVFVLIRLLHRVIKAISKTYNKSSEEKVTETDRIDLRTRIGIRNPLERMRNYLSMEERARRIYRKRILDCRKDRVPGECETTEDILEALRKEEGIELPELTELYNRVRYGSTVPDRDYLSRMRRADRKKRTE